MSREEFIKETLQINPGDILIYEMPFDDANREDMFPIENLSEFEPQHTAMWVTGSEKPIAHSVREGYKLPGLRLTAVTDARCMVFRNIENNKLNQQAAAIIKNWALGTILYSKEDYIKSYPLTHWQERHDKDLKNFYESEHLIVPGPAIIYPQPRAQNDLFDLARDSTLAVMNQEGLRRAVKFSSRRLLSSPEKISKGQRCTPMVVAAVQAAILAPIVKASKMNVSFKKYKNRPFEEYADNVLVEGWRETELGKKIVEAFTTNDYSKLFPAPFAVDQRYAYPNSFYKALQNDKSYQQIGSFSCFETEVETITAEGKISRFNSNKANLKR